MKGRARGRSPKTTPAAEKGLDQAVDLVALRQQITNLVGGQAVAMVETTIEQATKGQYAAMKYLFELVGLYPASALPEARAEDSLAQTLLRRLGLPEEPFLKNQITKEPEQESQAESADAVE